MTLQDPLDIRACLDEFRCLKDGWLDGRGLAPAPDGLDWLGDGFDRHFAADLPLPYLYPTPEGGVQAEWTIGDRDITLAFDLQARTAEWHCLRLGSKDAEVLELDFRTADAWRRLEVQLREALGGAP